MSGRYAPKDYNLDFSRVAAPPEAPRKRKDDPLESFLRFLGGIAPAAGTAIGGGIGAAVGGPLGIPVGAGLGAAAGQALGAGATWGADERARPQQEAEDERVAREMERKARAEAAMRMLGSMG